MASPTTASSAMQAICLPSHHVTEQILTHSFNWLCAPTSLSIEVTKMGSARQCVEPGRRGRGQLSVKQSLCDAILQLVIQRARAVGHGNYVCEELQAHFAGLPARYALNVDPNRHEDVLLHMRLLHEAREAENYAQNYPEEPYPLPNLHVRKVLLHGRDRDDEGEEGSRGIPIPRVPKPAFGSNLNLAGLGSGSPSSLARHAKSGSPSWATPPSKTTPPGFSRGTPPSYRATSSRSHLRHRSGSYTSLSEMEEDSSGDSSGQSAPEQDCSSPVYGWEITVATADRHGLMKYLTSALCCSSMELNIKEAHVFSTTDGMALEVFVVDGWSGDDPEELRSSLLQSVCAKLSDHVLEPPLSEEAKLANLRASVEAMAYEDWAVDFGDLQLRERLGGGSSGRLYRGLYRGQEVAVKIISISEGNGHTMSGSMRDAAPGAELLQMFKQEVAIMRIVRHKNLVQFIGACSHWPKLCIVTELMGGGSVRDVIQKRGAGLELPTAIRVLRDAARGLDFLHKRGIVHRDVKAANLLIDEHEVVKVCDFGVARMLPSVRKNRGEGEAVEISTARDMTAETGTYRWMAPEVLEHRPYDHKADVYSFGIMIWEILTGDIPYTGLTPLQAAIGVVQRGLRPVMPAIVPPKLTALAERCWSANTEERPEFSEVLTILEEYIKPAMAWPKVMFGHRRK